VPATHASSDRAVPRHSQFQISEDRHLVIMCLAAAILGLIAATVGSVLLPLGPAWARLLILALGGIGAFGIGDQYLRLFGVSEPSETGELRPLWFMWVSYFVGFAAWSELGLSLKFVVLFVIMCYFVLSGLLAIAARVPHPLRARRRAP
jgi:hypothetical protein